MTYCAPFPQDTAISQEFGTNPGGLNPSGGHTGRDYAVPIGTPVHAGADGVIEYAGTFDGTYADNLLWLLNYGGNTIVLNCGDTEPTFNYAHLSQFLVTTGDRVTKGQVIGLSGNSGTATSGPHCHVEEMLPGYNLNSNTYGRTMPTFDEYPENLEEYMPEQQWYSDMINAQARIDRASNKLESLIDNGWFSAMINAQARIDIAANVMGPSFTRVLAAIAAIPGITPDIIAGLKQELASELKSATSGISVTLTNSPSGQ